MKSFKKIAVANRGEIAVRIIQTIKEMGIRSVLLHSSEDQDTLAFRLADETLCIGAGEPQLSYLNVENIMAGLQSSGADALHPGVGFLSESTTLAQSCRKVGITFIGPTHEQLELFGDKIKSLEYVKSLDVPVLPQVQCSSKDDWIESAKALGYPLLVKSAHGGGGIGITKVNQEEDLIESIQSTQRLSQTAFGSNEIFLEKYLDNCQHIEVQIFGDFLGQIYHLYERHCSIQRRNQKIIEEASSNLSENLKNDIFQTACKIAESIGYQGAGTVEFLVQDDQFYFIEMNTRLQVEHPVTEMLLGVDLVRAQVLNAMKVSPFLDYQFQPRGHAIECRVCSQDSTTLIPVSGQLGTVKWRQVPHSRFDMGYESYDRIPSFYDSLIGKVIVWDINRARAIEKMKMILQESIVFGIPTNIPELLQILSSVDFVKNQYNVQFMNQKLTSEDQWAVSQDEKQLIQKYINLYSDNKNTKPSTFNPWFYDW